VRNSSALLAATGDHWPYSGATKLHNSCTSRSVRSRFVPLRDYVLVPLLAIPQVA